MKILLLIIALSSLPCTVGAEIMTRDEAERIYEQRILLPCIKKTFQMREGGPPKYLSPAKILNTWKTTDKSRYRDMMNKFVDILVWAPKEKIPFIIDAAQMICPATWKNKTPQQLQQMKKAFEDKYSGMEKNTSNDIRK